MIFLLPLAPFMFSTLIHHHIKDNKRNRKSTPHIITTKYKGKTSRVRLKRSKQIIRGPIYTGFHSQKTPIPPPIHELTLDLDSFDIGIDTYCSVTMSPNIDHFVTFRKTQGIKVRGIGNTLVSALGTGTILWLIKEKGMNGAFQTAFIAPISPCPYCHPNTGPRKETTILLARTGHGSQQAAKTLCLQWSQRHFTRTVLFNGSNTPTLRSAPGIIHYAASASLID
jgi:hypothetical protein